MALAQYKTQILLLHSQQSTLDSLGSGFSDKYSVHLATSGTEALNIFNDTPVHAFASEQDLPGMSGLDALREAKKRSPETIGILLAGSNQSDGLEAMVGEQEVFQIVRGEVSPEALVRLVEAATTQNRLLTLAESANDMAANVDQPTGEHIIMETSENGSAIISDGTGQMPVLKPKKISIAPDAGGRDVDVLVLTKDEEFLSTIKDSTRGLHNVHHAVTPTQADGFVNANKIGVLVTDAAMVGSNIEILTQRLRHAVPRLVAVVAGRRDDGELLMDLINRGQVYRFLLKPVSPGRSRLAIEASIKHHLDAPDTAFKSAPVEAGAAASQPAPQPKPAAKAKPAAAASKPAVARQAPLTVSRNDSLLSEGLDDAFGDDSSFTETMTGIATSVGRKIADAAVSVTSKKKKKKKEKKQQQPELAAPDPAPAPVPTSVQTPVQTPVQRPVQTPVQRPVQTPVQRPVQTPVQTPIQTPVPRSVQTPVPAVPVAADVAASSGGVLRNLMVLGGIAAGIIAIAAIAWFMAGSDDAPRPEATGDDIAPVFEETDIALPVMQATTVDPASVYEDALEDARAARDAGQLIAPPGQNAVELFVAARSANPGDAMIAAEIDGVVEQVVGLAESAILEQRLDDAATALQMIELANPENPRLTFLGAQLAQLQLRSSLDQARVAIREGRFEDAGGFINGAAAMAGADSPEIQILSQELAAARSEQRLDEVLEMANARLDQNQLISPSNNNARYYYELALSNDPDNTTARQGLTIVAGKLALKARGAIDIGQLTNAEDLIRNARALDPESAEVAAATVALQDARDAAAEQKRQAAAAREAEAQRDRQRRAAEAAAVAAAAAAVNGSAAAPDTDSSPEPTAASSESATPANEEAAVDSSVNNADDNTETDQGKAAPTDAAAALVALNAGSVSSSPVAGGMSDPVVEKPAAIKQVPVSSLSRVNYVAPRYPRSAQRRNVTGSVDIAFTVSKNGTVANIEVLDSKPGTMFDRAAMDAVAQWRFDPTIENGRPVERRTAIRLSFNLQ